MTGVPSDNLKEFFAQSRSFDGERVRAAARSQRLAWIIAATSATLGLASMVAVIGMLPLRTVETRVIRVNETSGQVELVTPIVGTQTYTEAVTKHWIADYIRSREGFLFEEAPFAFRKVNLMSAEVEQGRFSSGPISATTRPRWPPLSSCAVPSASVTAWAHTRWCRPPPWNPGAFANWC